MPQINLKLTDDLNARIESEAGGKRERAGWIRDLIRDEIGPATESEPDTGHYPDKERDRKIYEALLQHGGDDILKGYVRFDDVKPEIAQQCQVGKDDIYQSLKRMERFNHVRLDNGMYEGDAVRILARPPQADPDQWTKAKGRNRTPRNKLFRTRTSDSTAKRRLLSDIESDQEAIEQANDELDQLESAEVAQ